MRKVIVSASTEYAVLIGRRLLAQLGTEVAKRIRPCKAAVITDTTVEKLYAEQAEQSLAAAGFTTCRFSYPAGEGSKHIGTLSDMLEFLAEQEITRQDIIIALGGGVAGDMAGFAAAVYQRGIRFVADARPHFWRRWIPLSAAKQPLTSGQAKIWQARFISRSWCSAMWIP